MTDTLLTRDDSTLGVCTTSSALAMREAAMEQAALIGRVSNGAEQEQAVAAQRELRNVIKLAEDSRKKIKEPVLEYGRKIDNVAREFRADLETEELRLAQLIGDFQTLELQRIRAEEAARNTELDRLERDRQAALSQVTTHAEADRINEQFCAVTKDLPTPTPVRAEGQLIRQEWKIEVTDIWSLARAHPLCVRIEPRLSEIKQLLDAGATVTGVRAEKVVMAGVRVQKPTSALTLAAPR